MQAILTDGWIITNIQKPDVVLDQIDDDYVDMTGVLKHADHDRFNFQEPRRLHIPTNSIVCFIEDKDENVEEYDPHECEYENDYDEDYGEDDEEDADEDKPEEQIIPSGSLSHRGTTQKRRRGLFDGW